MSRLTRRYDKLLTEYFEVVRAQAELGEASASGGGRRAHRAVAGRPDSSGRIDRLAIRERSLAAAVRRVRVELGLPADVDLEEEARRLGSDARVSTTTGRFARARKNDDGPLSGPERQRVRPVPAPRRAPEPTERADLGPDLVAHAARFCGRRAAEELLARRRSPARGYAGTSPVAWPDQPLARNAAGRLYGGSPGPLMAELVGRARDGSKEAELARLAVQSYIAEFVDCVTDALVRERDLVARLLYDHARADDDLVDELIEARQELADAAYERIAVNARTARNSDWPTAHDVAELAITARAPNATPHDI